MKSRLIVSAILAGFLAPVIFGQEKKSEKPAIETKPSAPATMKLYEVHQPGNRTRSHLRKLQTISRLPRHRNPKSASS